jgi:O-succinylbenzoate synthase
MIIDALDVYYVANPLINPWKTAYGSDPVIYGVFVKMTSGNYSAWSESSPLYAPTYSPEFAYGVYHVVKQFLAPMVLHKDFQSAEELNATLNVIKGNPFAKSAIEIAWWTLESKITQKPLYEMLGGTFHEIDAGADFGVQDTLDLLLEKIEGAVRSDFKRIKLKAMHGWDINMLDAVRGAFPKTVFHIDCNSGYQLDDPLFKVIDKYNLAMIEQPLFHADLLDHAKLQARLSTPICLDESISSVYAAEHAIEIGAARYINIKPGRAGGLLNSIRINQLCAAAGIGCWIGGMLESAVGAGICIELASISNMTYPCDLFPSSTYYTKEITDNEIRFSSPGRMCPSKIPGNALYEPNLVTLASRTVESVHLDS